MENQANSSAGTGRNIFIAIIILLLGLNGVLGYLLMQEKEKVVEQEVTIENLEEETSGLQQELEAILDEYDMMETSNSALQAELDSARLEVEAMLVQVKKHKNDAYVINRLKKEAKSLREIMKGYLGTIDSLNTLNIELREQKAVVEQRLGKEQELTQDLSSQKKELEQTVKVGSRLRALDIATFAQRVKSNGVHRETNRAERAEKVKCCFTLDVNEIAKPGKRKIYLRVIDPNGEVVCDESATDNMFKFNGVEGLYTTFRMEDYQNEELDVCISYELKKDMVPGAYVVKLFTDELDIGEGGFVLK